MLDLFQNGYNIQGKNRTIYGHHPWGTQYLEESGKSQKNNNKVYIKRNDPLEFYKIRWKCCLPSIERESGFYFLFFLFSFIFYLTFFFRWWNIRMSHKVLPLAFDVQWETNAIQGRSITAGPVSSLSACVRGRTTEYWSVTRCLICPYVYSTYHHCTQINLMPFGCLFSWAGVSHEI